MRAILGLLGFICLANIASSQTNDRPYPIFEADKISNAEFKARREKVKAALQPGTVAIFFTNPTRNRNNDCDFRFRPDSTFWYITGCEEQESACLLAPGGVTIDGQRVTEVLFVNDRDPGFETWNGYQMGPARAAGILGFEASVSNGRFADVLKSLGKVKYTNGPIPDGATDKTRAMYDQFTAWNKTQEKGGGVNSVINNMRAIKSAAEVRLMQKCVDESVNGHLEAMKNSHAGINEWELQAYMEFAFTKGGCEALGYGSIVGSGENGCILHYETNRKKVPNGELVLMDCAGEYHGYSADITRTFPVNGKYTREQKLIYDLVYEAQEAGIKQCRAGKTMGDAQNAASAVLAKGLLNLGIIKKESELGRYFMHGVGHTIGLDVHDSWISVLKPNVMVTVEPGIYIRAGAPCDPKWWNIGVRIEDDILITEGDPVIMSGRLPRKSEDVERFMKEKKLPKTK